MRKINHLYTSELFLLKLIVAPPCFWSTAHGISVHKCHGTKAADDLGPAI